LIPQIPISPLINVNQAQAQQRFAMARPVSFLLVLPLLTLLEYPAGKSRKPISTSQKAWRLGELRLIR
jgi:hypothetical protein